MNNHRSRNSQLTIQGLVRDLAKQVPDYALDVSTRGGLPPRRESRTLRPTQQPLHLLSIPITAEKFDQGHLEDLSLGNVAFLTETPD